MRFLLGGALWLVACGNCDIDCKKCVPAEVLSCSAAGAAPVSIAWAPPSDAPREIWIVPQPIAQWTGGGLAPVVIAEAKLSDCAALTATQACEAAARTCRDAEESQRCECQTNLKGFECK